MKEVSVLFDKKKKKNLEDFRDNNSKVNFKSGFKFINFGESWKIIILVGGNVNLNFIYKIILGFDC